MSDIIECDLLIVGAGPAGLSAAIHAVQRAQENNQTLNVVVVEKGSEVGAHILSGAVLEPRTLNQLIPDWKEKGAPLNVPVTSDHFSLLTKKHRIGLPNPPQMNNHGNYIVSLGNVTRWLASQAEAMGVQIFPGFPAAEVIIEDHTVKGVKTGAFGISKEGEHKATYQEPMELRAKITLFAEGCRGSLTRKLMEIFSLRDGKDPQTYGLGIKEIWQIDPSKHQPGRVEHTIGWPIANDTYGGSFIYHFEDNQVAVGYVIGLDYKNPYLDPFREFQRFKHHPSIAPLYEGARRIAYGARTISEGGWQSMPKLTFPGGALIGDTAGFLNVPKIKGTHTAMASGMMAAEAAVAAIADNRSEIDSYEAALKNSWVADELYKVRNIRPAFRYGLWAGLAYSALDTYILRGRAPWTFHNHADHTALQSANCYEPIVYPAPDGKLSFDRMSSVYISNTNHEEDQPVHLRLKDPSVAVAHNLAIYAGPEQRYCPAGVYEFVEEGGASRLQINAQNCVHCKACDIKDPTQNIVWTTPEGGGGPNYPNM